MTLKQFIMNYGGPNKVAKKLGVTSFAVRYWIRNQSTPRPETLLKLVKISKGQLTHQSVLKETLKTKKKSKEALNGKSI